MTSKGAFPRTSLNVFVLAAVEAGLDSAYDLHRYADLSIGTTLPLLNRLQAAGLVRSKPAARRSRQYSLTSKGRLALRRSWSNILTAVPREFDAVLRLVYISARVDPTLKTTRAFLRASGLDRNRLAAEREREYHAMEMDAGQSEFGYGHRRLRAYCDSGRLKAEATMLSQLALRKDLATVLAGERSMGRV